MDLNEMLDNLALDLKVTLGSEISTTEGTRAIYKAVDELSRHIPRELIYDYTWVKAVTDDSFTTPSVASNTTIINAMNISASVDGDLATIASSWFDMPRPCKMTLTDADNSITRLTLIVKGVDVNGIYQEERIYRHGGKIQTGKVYFYAIYEIEISEIAGNGVGDVLSIGSDSPDLATGGVWIQLDNPIESGTESIYSASGKTGTKYILNTDYEMDYANGMIRMKNGGGLAVGTTYYANYSRASTSMDISNIIPELIRITKVLYPAGKVPEQSAAFSIWENMLTIGSLRPGSSQETLTDKDHVAIYYEGRQAPPSTTGPGSYPVILDEVVLVGAVGHALMMMALQYEQASVVDLASMRTELGLTTAVHALVTTTLAKAAVLVTATTGKVDVALAKVTTYFETGTDDCSKGALAKITTNITELRTKINTAVNAMATWLGDTKTISLDKATTGAEAYLDTGDDTINKLNDGGPDVASRYSDYSRTRIQIAQSRIQAVSTYAQEAQIRLSNIQSYIDEAGGWSRIAEGFIAEAQVQLGLVNGIVSEATTRIGQIDRYLTEASRYQEAAGINLILSDRFRAEGQARLNDFRVTLASKSEYRKKVVSVSVRQPS